MEHSFHLHLISDATGETVIAVSRAVVVQYEGVSSIEHVYPMVRSQAQLERVIAEIKAAPGVVLYTLVDSGLAQRLEAACQTIGAPSLSVLQPILNLFQAYLGAAANPKPGAQHMLNAHYFNRIDALNYTMAHDDGQMWETYEDADVLLIGVSRTSKTPTSIYLANRGVKAANVPLVPNMPLPKSIFNLK
ncbi:MAG: pyruvate, water dikinase regulatory protein, partial [Methylovirgula sp.]